MSVGWKKPSTQRELEGGEIKFNTFPSLIRALVKTSRKATPNADMRRQLKAIERQAALEAFRKSEMVGE